MRLKDVWSIGVQELNQTAAILQKVMQQFSEALITHREIMTHPEDPLSCLLLAKQFRALEQRVNSLESHISDFVVRIEQLEQKMELMHQWSVRTNERLKLALEHRNGSS